MASLQPIRTVVASAARTTTGNSGAITSYLTTGGDKVNLFASISGVTGTTPTLDLSVEWSFDGGTTFMPSQPTDSWTQFTAAGQSAVKQFVAKSPIYRIVWTIGGTTPSFTIFVLEVVSQ